MHRRPHRDGQRGAVLPLFALSIILLVGFAALAIDLGYLFVSRNELQNAADAAALAGARQLGNIYQGMDPDLIASYNIAVENTKTDDDGNVNFEGQYLTTDKLTVIHSARAAAKQNKATAQQIIIDPSLVEIGVWSSGTFTQQSIRPTAVRVIARRDASNPVETFFSAVLPLGKSSFPISATATAALTGKSSSTAGELELPIGVSQAYFDGPPSDWCGSVIKFSPTTDPDACAGWTTFTFNSNDANIRKILEEQAGYETPYNEVHDSFEFTNGDLSANSFETLLAKYQAKGVDVDKVHDPDAYEFDPGNYVFPQPVGAGSPVPLCAYYNATIMNDKLQACLPGDEYVSSSDPGLQLRYPPCQGGSGCTGPLRYAHEWETSIIIYASDDCNPNQSIPIKGYADVVVFNVGYPSYKVVQARIDCGHIDGDDSRGGGSDFGVLGSIPGLVE